MHWVYLCLAIVAEVTGSTALKQSDGFAKPIFAVLSLLSFSVSLFFLSLALRVVPLGIAYAVWAGVGSALVMVVGVLVFRQSLDVPGVLGIILITGGVVVINVFSRINTH